MICWEAKQVYVMWSANINGTFIGGQVLIHDGCSNSLFYCGMPKLYSQAEVVLINNICILCHYSVAFAALPRSVTIHFHYMN